LFNYDFGVINWFLGLFGVPKVNWLGDPVLSMLVLIGADVWTETGFSLLVFSAALAAIPDEILEAARMDGARRWQMLRHVIVPMMVPLFVVVALFRSYNLLRVYDLVYALTGGGPGQATSTLSYQIISTMVLGYQVGTASAMSYVLFGLSLVIGVLLIRVSLRGSRA
jgi:multiple sugar transport system permease protein